MGSRYESGVNTMGVLSRTEQKLVEEHLYLIRPLVLNVVHLNENVQGLGYDDLYQTACEALCHAALKYQDSRGASFPTFARYCDPQYPAFPLQEHFPYPDASGIPGCPCRSGRQPYLRRTACR